jgi:hypothetical protein
MKYALTVHGHLFEVVTSGNAEAATFRTCLEEVFRHERWRRGMPYLFDHSDLDSGPLTVNDVRGIADACLDFREEFGSSRLALLLRRDLEFGLARMWGVFMEGRWDATVGIFRSRDDAVKWLRETGGKH